ncbi:hypothetical protein [Streptomyces sp. NPDC057939]|uniref:hypothetical protein n=1 Tax=Streptomyces sp. NPDC057939 TaxID=3346284 RepID=UPI0036F15200
MTTGPHTAEPTPARSEGGAPKVVAEGVLSSVRRDPRADDGRRPVAWLHITAPGRGTTPTVRSWCACGRDLFAAGHARALAVIADHERHRTTCVCINPTANQEGKAA